MRRLRLVRVSAVSVLLFGCRGSDPGATTAAASAPPAPRASASSASGVPSAFVSARTADAAAVASRVLDLRENAPLAVQVLDERSFEAARRTRSAHGNFLLDAGFDTFRISAFPSKTKVFEGKGSTARWIAPTVVGFVDAKGHVAALDVTLATGAEKAKTTGGDACAGTGVACGTGRLPVLLWAAADVAHAVVRSTIDPALYDVQPAKSVRVLDGPFEQGEVVATAVGPTGIACALVGRTRPGLARVGPDGDRPEPGTAELHCADPAWAPPKKVTDFRVPDALERAGLGGGVAVQFSGDREVLVSLPVRSMPSDARPEALRHCVVTLAAGDTLCTDGERPAWEAVGDGRYALEAATRTKPPALVDLTERRAYPLGTKPDPWRFPRHDARDPSKLVVERQDKTPEWRGLVALP